MVLVKLAQMAADLTGYVRELDINPLLADGKAA